MKKFLAMLLALCMVFALCACGAKEEAPAAAPAEEAAPAAEGKTEVTVIAAQYGTQTADWWKGFEEKFEAANSDIDLVVEVVAWADINVVVDTRVANEQAPDLLNIDAYMKYYESDLLLPTDEWVSEETFAKFYPQFLAESTDAEGTVWAIPDLASVRALYVNKDILTAAGVEKAPTTWAELREACEKIKAYDPEIYPWGVDMTTDEGQAAFSYYTWNNNGGYTDANGEWAVSLANAFGKSSATEPANSGKAAFKTGGTVTWNGSGTSAGKTKSSQGVCAEDLLALELKALFPEVNNSVAQVFLQGGKAMYCWYTADADKLTGIQKTPKWADFDAGSCKWDEATAGVTGTDGFIMGTAPALPLGQGGQTQSGS